MPAIPIELVDIIVSFLPPIPFICKKNDLDKIAAAHVGKCGLVCRAWVPSSRRVLFYRINVRLVTAYRFAKLFQRPQCITFLPFIRELEFRDSIAQHSWMATVLPKIVKHLPSSIRSLVFEGRWVGFAVGALVPPSLGGITHFELVGPWEVRLSDALKCIASFPMLEELKVWLSHSLDGAALPNPGVQPPETLRSLNLKGLATEPLLVWIQESRVIISELHLSFPTSATSHAFMQAITRYIGGLGPSLASLSLIFGTRSTHNVPLHSMSLSLVACIAVLIRVIAFSDGFLKRNTRLHALYIEATPNQTLSLLKRTSLPPRLESLRIFFQTKPQTVPIWLEVDRMLESILSVRAVRLELAHFEVMAAASVPMDRTSVISAMFPLCMTRGIMIQNVEVERSDQY
jgi:hypothetical protein